MQDSLTIYGHTSPSIFYTDNMADKEFLENAFPSLCEDLVPIEKYSNLEPLTILEDEVTISSPLQTAPDIDSQMQAIIQLLPDDDRNTQVVVGFDAEYNVEVSSHGHVNSCGHTAIIQIACGKNIFILQVGQMVASGRLPSSLKNLLRNPHILKVGHCISADLRYLEQCCSEPKGSFASAVDLAKMAKEQLVVKCANIGLANLCIAVLHKWLNKNVSERVSLSWENEELSAEQIAYAALDAYCTLRIYEALTLIPLPTPLTSETPFRTPPWFTTIQPEPTSHNSAIETVPTASDSAPPESLDDEASTAVRIGMLRLDTSDSSQDHPALSTSSNFEVDAESKAQGD
ncbi:hypothetical protein GYMLUDRAFT_238979 [Collybiopsis luxurians FD-317 M1]|nr:hypothetical protein GYMLUDRAFT_238979 [Collybiopsis luxurians FD-317 M1]